MNKRFIRLLSAVLSVMLLIQAAPIYVSAEQEELPNSSDAGTAQRVKELVDQRTETTKHFLMSDGTYQSVIYPTPVHYEEDGKWEEINHSLVAVENRLKTVQTSNPISFGTTNDEPLFSITEGTNNLSFDLLGGEVQMPTSAAETLENPSFIDKITNQVVYEEVMEDTDLVYDIIPGKVKESIILNSPTEQAQYRFTITGDYTLQQNMDNSISVYEGSTLVYTIEAPFMVDAAGAYSDDIEVSLTSYANGNSTLLTLTPNANWLNSTERVYPITIDPTLNYAVGTNLSISNGVNTITPSGQQGIILYLGTDGENTYDLRMEGEFFTAYQDSLAENCYITEAYMFVPLLSGLEKNSNGIYATAHINEQIGFQADAIDNLNRIEQNAANGINQYIVDITEATRYWEENSSYGITLKYRDGYEEYIDSERLGYSQIVINYVTHTGIDDNGSYTSMSLDGLVSAMVDNLTGEVAVQFADYTSGNLRAEYSIGHVYRDHMQVTTEMGDDVYGAGFNITVDERLTQELLDSALYADVPNSRIYYLYVDGTGRKYEFYYTPESDDTGDAETEETTVTTATPYSYQCAELPLVTLSISDAEIRLISDSGVTRQFVGGYLRRVIAADGNTIFVSYNADSLIEGVSELISTTKARNTTMAWQGERLIGIRGADGSSVSYTYTENLLTKVTYSSRANYLTSGEVTGSGELQSIEFSYDANGLISEIQNTATGSKITFTRNGNRVERVCSYVRNKDSTELRKNGEATFDYGINITKATDVYNNNYHVIYTFNSAGHLMTTTDSEGMSKFYNYEINDNGWTDNVSFVSVVQERVEEEELLQLSNGSFTPTVSGYYTYQVEAKANEYNVATVTLSGGGETQTASTVREEEWETLAITEYLTAGVTYTYRQKPYVGEYRNSKLFAGDYVAKTNLLQNGGFSDGTTAWLLSSADYIEESNGTLAIEGDYSQVISASQAVTIDGTAGDVISFGGSGNTNGLPNMDGMREYGAFSSIRVTLHYNDDTTNTQLIHFFANSSGEWIDIFGNVQAQKDYNKITFTVEYAHNANTSYFDHMRLYRNEPIGTTYYYTDNRITSVGTEEGGTQSYTYTAQGDVATETDVKGNTTTYTYDENRNVITSSLLYRSVCEYDAYGNLEKVVVASENSDEVLYAGETIYNSDGTAVIGEKNALGGQTTYAVDAKTLLTTSVTTATGLTETLSFYQSDTTLGGTGGINGLVKEKTRTSGTNQLLSRVTFDYRDSALYKINRGHFSYVFDNLISTNEAFTIDGESKTAIGKNTVAMQNGTETNAISTTYYDSRARIIKTTLANGGTSLYDYNEKDQMIFSTDGVDLFRFRYSPSGLLRSIINTAKQETKQYYYDSSNRLVGKAFVNAYNTAFRSNYRYDIKGIADSSMHEIDGFTFGSDHSYNAEDQITRSRYSFVARRQQMSAAYSYDDYGRMTSKQLAYDTSESNYTMTNTTYNYIVGANGKTAMLNGISSTVYDSDGSQKNVSNSSVSYDASGNISSVFRETYSLYDDYQYTYDELCQLTSMRIYGGPHNQSEDYTYVYDSVDGYQGNLATKTIDGESYTYVYDEDWTDLLLQVKDENNQAVRNYTYDASGNPLSDGVYSYTWNGTRLQSVRELSDNSLVASFTYDEEGLRTSKVTADARYEYFYSDGLLRAQKITRTDEVPFYLLYHYGEFGLELIEYYLIDGDIELIKSFVVEHNPQGMIETLYEYNEYGTYQGQYHMRYTSFGECLMITNGNLQEIDENSLNYTLVMDLFSVRYKDYCYDAEFGLYYLQQRYYDPFTCRFISPDTIVAEGQGTGSYNIFAYCGNNPVMYADQCGNLLVAWATSTFAAIASVIHLVTVIEKTAGLAGCALAVSGALLGVWAAFTNCILDTLNLAVGIATDGFEKTIQQAFDRFSVMDCGDYLTIFATMTGVINLQFASYVSRAAEVLAGAMTLAGMLKTGTVFFVDGDIDVYLSVVYIVSSIDEHCGLIKGYISSWAELLSRASEYASGLDANTLSSSHGAQEMFVKINTGTYNR